MSATATTGRLRTPVPDQDAGPADVFVGDDVYWYDGDPRGATPHAAKVLAINFGTSLCLGVFRPELARGYEVKDGVKLHSDPTLKPDEQMTNGCWGHHPRVRRAADLRARVEKLVADLTPAKK